MRTKYVHNIVETAKLEIKNIISIKEILDCICGVVDLFFGETSFTNLFKFFKFLVIVKVFIVNLVRIRT